MRAALVMGLVALSACKFPIDTQQYFNSLDYNDVAVALQMPDYEHELCTMADALVPYLGDPKAKRTPADAMPVVYAAFYMANANYAADEGHLSYAELTRHKRYAAAGAGLPAELAARERQIREYALLARPILAQDPRHTGNAMIAGMIASTAVREEYHASGRVSERSMERLIAAAEQASFFNTISALITLSDFDVPEDLELRLFKLVQGLTPGQSPCDSLLAPPLCMPSRDKVPYAFHGIRVLLGDAYFKRGARLLARDPADAIGGAYARQALTLYRDLYDKKLFFGGIALLTAQWRVRDGLDERIEAASALVNYGGQPRAGFWRSGGMRRAYQCAACHSK